MENELTINKLWNLRGELDEAVLSQNYAKISEIKEKYNKMVDHTWGNTEWVETDWENAFVGYHYGFRCLANKREHVKSHIRAIHDNIASFEKKYIWGAKNTSLKLKTGNHSHYLAADIWVLRAMYDKFLINAARQASAQGNMILGEAIIDKLTALSRGQYFLEQYADSIIPLIGQVRKKYESYYGKKRPNIDYSTISKEYFTQEK